MQLTDGVKNLQLEQWRGTFANHILEIYGGAVPATAAEAETGTLLLIITKDGAAFTPGMPDNGLNFAAPVDGSMSMPETENAQGVGIVSGTATYYRMYANDVAKGTDPTARRVQGTVGTSNADLILSSVEIVAGAITTINSHIITQP